MPTPVVLVHGLRTSATMWRRQVQWLTGLGHEVRAIDLPGHGERMSERFSIDAAMRVIDDAVTASAEPPLLVGFSLGGYLSLHYAGLDPRPIAGLVAAGCGTQAFRPVLAGWRVIARVIHRFPDRGAGLNHLAVRLAVRDPQLAEDVESGGVALEVMDDALRELRGLDTRASISRIHSPIWFVNGQFDHFRLQERRFLAAAADGTLVRVPGATHLVSLTRPEAFERELLGILAAVGSTPAR